ncbi:MAG: hypothetical protein NC253_03035 [Ruminococcus sp.]|nr:hypothetical protein [Ruminococcus sp.]MCM1380370.1 hypothetical protein [Muribaculaceae bacterium]MCM1478320.1 hypothetical protein [Muribaculaceae bacterium]
MKRKGIDTLRLRALHTACMTVGEIAKAMKIKPSDAAVELEKMGYKPIYKKDKPEPRGFGNKK